MSIAKVAIGLGMLGLGSAFVKKSKQAFVPRKEGGRIDLKLLPSGRLIVPSRDYPIPKPDPSFWTSSIEESATGWLDWCSFAAPEWIAAEAAVFEVDPNAKILNIQDRDQLLEAKRKHPLSPESYYVAPGIDWNSLSKSGEYDGVTCDPGASALPTQFRAIGCPDHWDVESTAWFNMDALKFVGVVDINKECRSIDEPDSEYEQKVAEIRRQLGLRERLSWGWKGERGKEYTIAPLNES